MLDMYFLKKGLLKLNHQEKMIKSSSLTQANPPILFLLSIKANNRKTLKCSLEKERKVHFKPINKSIKKNKTKMKYPKNK